MQKGENMIQNKGLIPLPSYSDVDKPKKPKKRKDISKAFDIYQPKKNKK